MSLKQKTLFASTGEERVLYKQTFIPALKAADTPAAESSTTILR